MHSLRYYAMKNEKFSNKSLSSRKQWRQLAQFEAIMYPAMRLCFDSQGDRPEIAGEMVLAVIQMKVEYLYTEEYVVVDVDAKEEWTADTPFVWLPRIWMTTNREKATETMQ